MLRDVALVGLRRRGAGGRPLDALEKNPGLPVAVLVGVLAVPRRTWSRAISP